MADANDTLARPENQQDSEGHPYAFADIWDARKALKKHHFDPMNGVTDELRRISDTFGALAGLYADEHDSLEAKGFYYLSTKLHEEVRRLEEWVHRGWLLSVIVGDNDLDALSKYPGTKEYAPPAREAKA